MPFPYPTLLFGRHSANIRIQIKKEDEDTARQATQRATGYIGGLLGGKKKTEADDEDTISEADKDKKAKAKKAAELAKSKGEAMDAAKKLLSGDDKDSKEAQRRGKSMFPSLTFPRPGI